MHNNNLGKVIESSKTGSHTFKPTRAWFKEMRIGHKRFWMLVRNETEMTIREAVTLAAWFKVPLSDISDDFAPYNIEAEALRQNPPVAEPDRYIRPAEALEILQTGRTSFYNLLKTNEVRKNKPSPKVCYYHKGDVLALKAKIVSGQA